MTSEELQQLEDLKNQIINIKEELEHVKSLDFKPQLIDWPTAILRVKRIDVISKGYSLYGVHSDDGYYVGSVNIVTSGRVIDNINSVAVDWNPNTNDTYLLGSASFKWADIKVVKINGNTPLAGTKVYYVSDSSGGAVTRKLTFVDGILTSEI